MDGIAEETGWSPKEIAKELGVTVQMILKYLSPQYKNSQKSKAGIIGSVKRRLTKESFEFNGSTFDRFLQNVTISFKMRAPFPHRFPGFVTIRSSTPIFRFSEEFSILFIRKSRSLELLDVKL